MSHETKTNFTDEEIAVKVIEISGEIVLMDTAEISIDSSLMDDLGMESIDFLDLVFRLESDFGISLPREDPVQRLIAKFEPGRFVKDGLITRDGVKVLKLVFPDHDESRIYEGMKERDVPSLITIRSYVNVVKRGLELKGWQPEKCDKCGSTEFNPQDKEKLEFPEGEVPLGPVFLCQSCNHMLIAPSFDEELLKKLETPSV